MKGVRGPGVGGRGHTSITKPQQCHTRVTLLLKLEADVTDVAVDCNIEPTVEL